MAWEFRKYEGWEADVQRIAEGISHCYEGVKMASSTGLAEADAAERILHGFARLSSPSGCDGRKVYPCKLPFGHDGPCHFDIDELLAQRQQALNDLYEANEKVTSTEKALKLLQEWDMLRLGPDGRGVHIGDAPWAQLLIRIALEGES